MLGIKSLKETVLSSFNDENPGEVDKYINLIRDSLKSTNSKFHSYTLLLIISLVAYHLYANHYLREISVLSFRISDDDFIRKWYLVIPSIIYVVTASMGYLRVFQQESIEWILARYRPKEYASGIYRLTFPSNYILGIDIMRRQKSTTTKIIAYIVTLPLAFGSIIAPMWYILWAYSNTFEEIGGNISLVTSFSASSILLICGLGIIIKSQKI